MRARIWWTVLGAALTVAFLVAIHNHRRSPPALPPSVPQPVFEQPEVPARVSEQRPAIAPAPLAAGNVIDNPNCRFFAGARDANDLAVVVVPDDDGDGARFSVVDAGGRVFDGGLPFVPDRASLGKRRDGAVLVAFGGRGEDHRPVQVFHGGDLVYEREFAWDFDVATDGSSYYAIEGSPYGEFSILVLRNLDLGIETQVDLSDRTRLLAPELSMNGGFSGRYRPRLLGVSYSHDNTEVVMSPLSLGGFPTLGHHRFVPVDGAEPRTIAVQEEDVVFVSSRLGYFYLDDGASPRVVKRRFDWASPGRSAAVDVWATELAAGTPFIMGLSDDGAWLIVSALPFAILDAATGNTAFEFPTAAELAQAVREVSGVEVAVSGQDLLRALAHLEDSPAALSGDIAEGAALLWTEVENGLLESLLTIRAANVLQAGESVESLHDWAIRDGKFEVTLEIENGPRTVAVFDMRDVEVDAQPAFRVDIDPKNPCASGDTWHAGLQVHDGELTYLTTKRAPPALRETLP